MPTERVPPWQLRARFALALAQMYGTEVPLYTTLVEVCREVNADVARARGQEAARLGSLERVTAERHGAIRVGSPRELAQVARVFAAFGMHPVGFYDLRDASTSAVPVVSTAFRPTDADQLARNPFRVFTSMLVTEDRRFFDAPTQARLEAFIAARSLFGAELLALADRAVLEGGLVPGDADRLLELATSAFRLTTEPIDRSWYDRLDRISAVAADIGGVPSTHINHLTPRVLDIDDLYARMQQRGITMIDEIQGPPAGQGPDVLLRQTSFRALAEDRVFREADGSISRGSLRVRFGEVEQRGIALTREGRDVYDRGEPFPRTESELASLGLGYFRYRLLDGVVVTEPIVYEDFLPRSAAGIFQSNLSDQGTRDDDQVGSDYDLDRLAGLINAPVHDPFDLYDAQQHASLREVERELGRSLRTPPRRQS